MQLNELLNLLATILIYGGATFLGTNLVKQVTWPAWLSLGISLVLAGLFAVATAWMNGDVMVLVASWGSITAVTVVKLWSFYFAAASVWYWVVFREATWAKKLGAWPRTLVDK